jgi:hypothetical protein
MVRSIGIMLRRSANLFFKSTSPVAPLGFRQVAITCPLSFFSRSCLTCSRQYTIQVLRTELIDSDENYNMSFCHLIAPKISWHQE